MIPLALYQHSTVGAWWATNYNSLDASLPNWKAIGPNLRFYITRGLGAKYFIVPALMIGGFLGLRTTIAPQIKKRMAPFYKKWLFTVLWVWGFSVCFFLTHNYAVEYYLIPPTFHSCV
jgi:hypothetical protein